MHRLMIIRELAAPIHKELSRKKYKDPYFMIDNEWWIAFVLHNQKVLECME